MSYTTDSYVVNRSPFAHGKHQDTFHVRTYQRQLKFAGGDAKSVGNWMHYVAQHMPAGVGYEYEVTDTESLFDRVTE